MTTANKIKVLIFIPMFLAACSKTDETGRETSGPNVIETVVEASPAPQRSGATADKGANKPDYIRKNTYFTLPDYKGGKVDLADYAGKPTLLMFFTETCPYCRRAAPFMEKIHKDYKTKGLGVIGICVEEEAGAAAGFARDFGLDFPVAYEGGDVAGNYRAQGVPYLFLLGKDHAIYNVWIGFDPAYKEEIIEGIETVLKR